MRRVGPQCAFTHGGYLVEAAGIEPPAKSRKSAKDKRSRR